MSVGTRPDLVRALIERMPKVELHVHLEGTLRPEMRIDLARRHGLDIGYQTADQIVDAYDFHDLPSFIAAYNASQEVLLTEADFQDLAWDYLLRCRTQQIRHVELFFDPQLHTARGVAIKDVISGYSSAVKRAAELLDVSASLILCFVRDLGPEAAMSTLREAIPLRDRFIGVGLDSVEEGHPPSDFHDVFALARREGLQLTFHSDLDQTDQTEHLRQGLEDLGCRRVDHGLHVLDDETLLNRIRRERIGLTATPLGYATFDPTMRLAQIRELLEAGVAISIGSDDPAFFGGDLVDALDACAQTGNFTLEDLIQLQRNAIDTCWAPEAIRSRLTDELDAFAQRHAPGKRTNAAGDSDPVAEPADPRRV